MVDRNKTLNNVVEGLPPELQGEAREVWSQISKPDQDILRSLAQGIPSRSNLLKMLVHLTSQQLRQSYGDLSRVVICGPANVGKSTLFNRLVQDRSDQAAVSPTPGTTRRSQAADAGIFTIIDTPGADPVGPTAGEEKARALQAAGEADLLVILFDAQQGIKRGERDIFDVLAALGKPYVVGLNKIDLVDRDRDKVQRAAAASLQLETGQVIPFSARSGRGLDALLLAIAASEPRLVAALGRSLPQFRWKLARRNIINAASLSAVIALIPLPVLDFGPLIINQTSMVLGIARIYGFRLNWTRARELAVTFGLGLAGRMLFQELSKLGGLPGWLLSAAIASSTTVVMGYAAARWFGYGERVSPVSLQRISRDLTVRLLGRLSGLGKQKPGNSHLQEAVTQSLQEIEVEFPAQDR